jgi:hypothetical protein
MVVTMVRQFAEIRQCVVLLFFDRGLDSSQR